MNLRYFLLLWCLPKYRILMALSCLIIERFPTTLCDLLTRLRSVQRFFFPRENYVITSSRSLLTATSLLSKWRSHCRVWIVMDSACYNLADMFVCIVFCSPPCQSMSSKLNLDWERAWRRLGTMKCTCFESVPFGIFFLSSSWSKTVSSLIQPLLFKNS